MQTILTRDIKNISMFLCRINHRNMNIIYMAQYFMWFLHQQSYKNKIKFQTYHRPKKYLF